MPSYEEEKEKDHDKHHGGKNAAEDPVTNETHDFGSVSKEIDNILGDISNSHDEKAIETEKQGINDAEQEKQREVPNQKPDVQTPEQSSPLPKPNNQQGDGKSDGALGQEKDDSSNQKPESDPFSHREPQPKNQGEQNNNTPPTPMSKPKQGFSSENQDSKIAKSSETTLKEQQEKNQRKTVFSTQKTSSEANKGKAKLGLFGKKQTLSNQETTSSTVKGQTDQIQKKSFGLFSKKNKTENKSDQKIPKPIKNKSNGIEYNLGDQSEDAFHQPIENQDVSMDQDVLKLLAITDDLLGKLPEDVISEFASSEDFKLYKKVMDRYNIGK